MRNLKRVLSLAMATAMLLGMMVVGASAADKKASDLTDADKITNKEAVTLLVDLGVVEGKSDGSYGPTETVNRATMAKLITVMMLGNVDSASFKGTTTDLTDINGHWAEGYIKYCYANKIITGDGAGHFFPDEPVTTVQAAKMLLVAIGYNAADRKYENDGNWSINIMRDAQSTKESATVSRPLTKGISVKSNDPLSRDNAAQMIFNTLFVKTVEPKYQWDNGKQYISEYTEKSSLAATTYNGVKVNSGVIVANEKSALSGAKTSKGESTISGVTGDVKIGSTISLLGHEVVWYTDNGGLVSSAFVPSGKTATKAYTYETATKYNEFVKDFKLVANPYSDNYGVAKGSFGTTPNAGDTLTFIDSTADGTYDYIVKVAYTFGEVTATVANSDKAKATVTISGLIGTRKLSDIECTDTLAKGDYVLTATIGGSVYVEKAASFTGTVTATSATKLTVDSTAYSVNNTGTAAADTAKNIYTGTDYKATFTDADSIKNATPATFYTDKGGVIMMVKGEASATSTSQYAAVVGVKTESDEWNSADKTTSVRIVLADGTTEVYEFDNGGTIKDAAGIKTGSVYSYSITNKNKIQLNVEQAVVTTKVELTKGTASYKVNGSVATNSFLDSNTVVVFYKLNSDKTEAISAYTGVANIPSTVSTSAKNVIVTNAKDKTVDYIFVYGQEADTAEAGDAIYAFCENGTLTNTANGSQVTLIVNGESQKLILDGTSVTPVAGKTYTLKMKGEKAVLSNEAALGTAYKVLDVGATYVVVDKAGVPTTYTFADGMTVDNISLLDDDGNIQPSTATITKDSNVSLILNDAGTKVVKAFIGQTPSIAGVSVTKNTSGTFTAEALGVAGGKVTYAWVGGTAGTPDSATTTLADGTYTLTITVTGNTGATATLVRTVTITGQEVASVVTPA